MAVHSPSIRTGVPLPETRFPLRFLVRFRHFAVNVALLLVSLLLVFVTGEILTRLLFPQQLILLRPDIWQPMDSLGYTHRAKVHTTVNTGERTVHMMTDANGFRIGAVARPPGEFRILLLGDSFMAAMQVEYEQSLAGLIERCVPEWTGHTVTVANAAVAGWDPPQYYLEARRVLAAGRFDLVVVAVFLGNDVVGPERRLVMAPLQPDLVHRLRFPGRLSWNGLVDALLAPINDQLKTRSQFYVFLKNRSQNVLMRLGLTGVYVPSELRRTEAESRRWQVTGGLLAGIDTLARQHGTPTLFVLIPSIEQVDSEVLARRTRAFHIDPASLDLDQPDRLMRAQLTALGLEWVSLLDPLRAAQARGVQLYGRVDPHPTAVGHQVMWNAVATALTKRLGIGVHSRTREGACRAP